MTTDSAPSPSDRRPAVERRRPLATVALLLLGAVVGAALVALLQLVPFSGGHAPDPAGAECANAFDAFRLGERTSSLLQLVDDCTAEAR